jgi:uncharacterized protein (TIGR03083 family)
MTLTTQQFLDAITEHSTGFADAVAGNLDAPVEHCPGWTVADLTWHLTDVHWFWGTIVEGLLEAPPDEGLRPPRPDDAGLVAAFRAGAERLVRVLHEADQSAHCWTWAGWKQDVAFVTRHQVQEAAVHHWDAAHSAGASWAVDPPVAVDSVDEFLHFSVASDDDPDEPVKPPLDGTLAFRCSDTGDAWTLTDGARPGTAKVSSGAAGGAPVVEAPASDLLLWLYGRTDVDTAAVEAELLQRFRDLCFTD